MRRELGQDVEMIHGRYGEFKVLVDGTPVVDGGSLAFLGIMPSMKATIEAVRDALAPERHAPLPPDEAA
jgi:hypothetical protein